MDSNSIKHAIDLADDLAQYIGTGYGTGTLPDPTPDYLLLVETKVDELIDALLVALDKEQSLEIRLAVQRKHLS